MYSASYYKASGIMCFFLANYVLFFGELCAKNPKKCMNYVNCTIFLCKNFSCFNLSSLQIFFGFTFNKKLSIFKVKTLERKLFCHQIN